MLRYSKTSLVEKTGYREKNGENGEKRDGDIRKARIVLAISMEKLHTVR